MIMSGTQIRQHTGVRRAVDRRLLGLFTRQWTGSRQNLGRHWRGQAVDRERNAISRHSIVNNHVQELGHQDQQVDAGDQRLAEAS